MKILTVVGTRPEAIKMVPVIQALKAAPDVDARLCVTAQHRSMLDQVLQAFEIEPDYDLNLMAPGQSLTAITASVLVGLEPILREFRPDWLIVQGDTTSTMAATLAGFYQKVQVAHVEAGLRTRNLYAPWPEEANRRIADSLSSLFFAPTERARRNLLEEAIPTERIVVTGNTVIDALLQAGRLIDSRPGLRDQLAARVSFLDPSKKLILVTGHRRENFGAGFENICSALSELAGRSDVQIVYPVHLNPNVQDIVRKKLSKKPNVILLEPLDYFPFVLLLSNCYLVLTDSGGIQEEAPALGKPVLVMRDVTERPEAIESGTGRLIGTDSQRIVSEVTRLLDEPDRYEQMAKARNPFGDGTAANRIVEALLRNGVLE
jgi:UDP-N-acetylglucosamine 2-epimerase (non-hydrolysing)